ncbi:Mitochondrial import inner membrane translocase subunit Tim9 [Intoshia linei]|uniref:Mitochondrial import inner membrane translocase subunit n=1 Tax=Intoshia linei TaxID=1819745 RepID=A0A177B8B0_9BILA|nr:Mitochondrial import inner membrane translocase subunit Tim9 [Intoshia linei]
MSNDIVKLDVNTEASYSQIKEFLEVYNKISQKCFKACVFDFTNRTINSNEKSCAENYMNKYLKMTERMSGRFGALQLQRLEESKKK